MLDAEITGNEHVKNREKKLTEIVIMSHVGCNDTCNRKVESTER